MQFRKFSWLLIWCLLFLSFTLSAQELRKNEKGERIIVYPDGSWEYFVPSKNLDKDSVRIDRSSLPKYPTFAANVLPLKNPISLTQEDERKIAMRHAQLAKEASSVAQRRAEDAKFNRAQLETMLNQNNVSDDELNQLNKRLEVAKLTEQRTVREAMLAVQEYENAEKAIEEGSFSTTFKEETTARSGWESPAAKSFANTDKFYEFLPTLDAPFEHKQSYSNAAVNNKNCQFSYEGVDKMNGQWRRDLKQENLFNYTDNRLRMYLKDKDYLRCEAFMTSLGGGHRLLSLKFTFAYPNAREAYGFIEKGSMLIIKLLNGGFIQLHSGKMDKGRYDTEKEILTYEVHYAIGQNYLKSLQTSEIDSIIVSWSSGYEEYQVYNLDFFQNQISCLEK